MTTDGWHGWQRPNRAALHIGPLPGRKSMALYVEDGSVVIPVAYFRDEDHARQTMALIDYLIEGPSMEATP